MLDSDTSPHQKPGEVQAHEQHREGVDEPGLGAGSQALREQGAVGERELEVSGEQARVERVAVGVDPAADDAERLDGGLVQAAQVAQHGVLAPRDVLLDLLDGEDATGQADEPDDVPGDAAGEGGEVVLGPVLQRRRPRQVEQRRVRPRGRDLQGHRLPPTGSDGDDERFRGARSAAYRALGTPDGAVLRCVSGSGERRTPR